MLTKQWRAYLLVLPGLVALGCGSDNGTTTKRDAGDAGRRDGGGLTDAIAPDVAADLPSYADAGDAAFVPDASDAADAIGADAVVDASFDGPSERRDVAPDAADVPPRFDGPVVDTRDAAEDRNLDGNIVDVGSGQDGRDAARDGSIDIGGIDATPNSFVATLTGGEVVPLVRSTATGTASFELSTAGTTLTYQLSLANLGATSVGIFVGAAGENGTQVYPLTPISGNMTGTLTITPTDAANLAAGMWYVSVQSAAYPNGEVRGQILRPDESLWVARLTGAQEVPPVATSATGHAALVLNAGQSTLRYHIVLDNGVTPTAVRVQVGIAAQTGGPVALDLIPVSRAMDGVVTITPTDRQNLLDHHWYLNVVTSANTSGELRGQVLMPGETLYSASMDGASETPPVTTPATGASQFILDRTGTVLSYEAIFVGLSATAAHIHSGAVGVAGPVVYPLTVNATGSGAKGSLTVTASDVTNLDNAAYYANAHTAAHPDGEIRGQITRQ